MANRIPESRELTTTLQVWDALGGLDAICALTGSPPKAAENWKRQKTFPSRYFLVMTFALRRKRLSAPPELWGQVTPAQRRQALSAVIADQQRRMAS